MPRIVSLISSATEMLRALGALDQLVGRSHECDYPPAVRDLPACTKPLIDINADSRTIDEQVRNSARSTISIYEVFDDVLERLQPTHILTQVQCDVCAVSLRDVERSIATRIESKPALVALNPDSLAAIWDDFRRVGAAAAVDAEPVIDRLRERMAEMSAACAEAVTLSVACIEWIEPLMAAGNWTPELIGMAGAIDVFGQPGVHSPWITWVQLTARDPDVIIVAPCGFDLARTRSEMHWMTGRAEFSELTAVRTGRIYLADGNQFFNRPGPRVVETLQIISEILHSGATRNTPTLRGAAWEPFPV